MPSRDSPNCGGDFNRYPGTYCATLATASSTALVINTSSASRGNWQKIVSRMINGGSAGLSTMIALPRPARPTSAIARDVVRVNSSMLARVPGPGRDRGDGGDDLGVVDLGHRGDGVDDRDGGLAGARDHVDVDRVEVLLDVRARARRTARLRPA